MDEDVDKLVKILWYHTVVQSFILYDFDMYTLKEGERYILRVSETSVLRKICGLTIKNSRWNLDTMKELFIAKVIIYLMYFGQVISMKNGMLYTRSPSYRNANIHTD